MSSGSASSIPYIGDHYDTLGLTREATPEEVKKAYRKLARECHPDVAGDDPEAARRFNRIQQAYEILSDPEQRRAYDTEGQRRGPPRSRWTDEGYRMPGGLYVRPDGSSSNAGDGAKRRPRRGATDPANNIDLEDIFGDFGVGSGKAEAPKARPAPGRPPAGGRESVFPGGTGAFADADGYMGDLGRGGGGGPKVDNRGTYGARGTDGARVGSPGRDIQLTVDISGQVARAGGVITLEYPRLRLSEDGRVVSRYEELYDLRVPPGVRTGQALRVPRMGDAGTDGTTGDLVCALRISPEAARAPGSMSGEGVYGPGPASRAPGRATPPPAPPPAEDPTAASVDVPITVVEAILGGRIEVDTPAGRVRLAIPAGTNSGKRLRLRGKGAGGADLYVVLQIVVPKDLDAESRALIERFAELNPDDPRAQS